MLDDNPTAKFSEKFYKYLIIPLLNLIDSFSVWGGGGRGVLEYQFSQFETSVHTKVKVSLVHHLHNSGVLDFQVEV